MTKAVPEIKTGNPDQDRGHGIVRQALNWIIGAQKNAPVVQQLSSTASTSDIINAVNSIITRINPP